ncbi:thiazole synthase [Candidatus Marinamargulisbacteria bacterium SCGC AG-343-D04]|nr:thiazole synthase [Candidatus Marinamargulisbacteria bacterium SCGC AG-343-D04]
MLIIGDHSFSSRLILGTGKFSSQDLMKESIGSSECEMVTLALRRVDFSNQSDDFMASFKESNVIFMPNTSGARTADEAVRIARLACTAGNTPWVKIEVTPEPDYLLPDPIETVKASEILVKEGYNVLPYINADPILAKRLEEIGCVAVMPLAAPIGTNKGLETKVLIEIIIEKSSVPVIVDAGLGAPSHAAHAMEMGADAVLVNTAIATANDPVMMARAFKQAVESGREAYLAGLPGKCLAAQASSPLTGFLHQ